MKICYTINNVVYSVVDNKEDKMKTVNDLLEQAISETLNLNNNEVFLLKDLFKGYEWNRISRGDRLLLGTLFLNYVNSSRTYLHPIEKTSSKQQKYRVCYNQ